MCTITKLDISSLSDYMVDPILKSDISSLWAYVVHHIVIRYLHLFNALYPHKPHCDYNFQKYSMPYLLMCIQQHLNG